MTEEIMVKEADPPVITLEEEAVTYLEEQQWIGEQEFKNCAITVVLQLMPVDDHPQGRMGLLSVRNDDDAPLFTTSLRGEELAEFLQIPRLARLVEELRNLLPQRLIERTAKAKEQAKQTTPQATSRSAVTLTKGKGAQKSARVQPEVPTKPVSATPGTISPATTPNNPSVPQATLTSKPATQAVTKPVEDTTRQLTLF
ncbi:MAG TPA: hypothetical protein VH186_23150 [Chloroflexia bacterium]|nr:hypothetical protein [Chloroflexia bacterium]